MAAKDVLTRVKIELDAGQARVDKVGQALGPYGVNIVTFVGAYNDATKAQRGLRVPVEVTIFQDRSFDLDVRTPATTALLRRAAGIERGSARPGIQEAGAISRDALREVAAIKLPDLSTDDLDQAERIVAGTARSMGITVKD